MIKTPATNQRVINMNSTTAPYPDARGEARRLFSTGMPSVTDINAAEFVLSGEFTSAECIVSLAGELLEQVNSDFSAELRSYNALKLLAYVVRDQLSDAIKKDNDQTQIAIAGDSLCGLISLIEDREDDDDSLVYAALTLLRFARAQVEAMLMAPAHVDVQPAAAAEPARKAAKQATTKRASVGVPA